MTNRFLIIDQSFKVGTNANHSRAKKVELILISIIIRWY